MPIGKIEPSGCGEFHGNVKIRLDMFLEPDDYRYDDPDKFYVVDTESAEFKAGYLGEVDKEGNPKDQAAHNAWFENLPHVWLVERCFHFHFIYCDSNVTETEIEAEINHHLPSFYAAWCQEKDKIKGGMRSGWDVKTRTRPLRYEEVDEPEIFKLRKAQCTQKAESLKLSSLSIKSKDIGEIFPATDIDIGEAATTRAGGLGLGSYTRVNKGNPANGAGEIDACEIYLHSVFRDNDIWAGTFSASGNDLTCRDSESMGNIAKGSKQTITGLSIIVESGDYFGAHDKAGAFICNIYHDETGGDGIWRASGEHIDPNDSTTFTLYSAYVVSLYGTGETVAVGWTGKIDGVVNPAKIMGVPVANIAKVKGVA